MGYATPVLSHTEVRESSPKEEKHYTVKDLLVVFSAALVGVAAIGTGIALLEPEMTPFVEGLVSFANFSL